jgi:creatinine amidohydrolase
MTYSIFQGTMADMNYQDIEKLIAEKAVVLLPIGVIEEHGPHLPLGTDTYLTYSMFKYVQSELEDMGVKSVIAPPFYWGINVATSGFPGSFTVKVETMKAVLKDIIENLYSWGFENVYMLNMHGDGLHCMTLLETAKEISELGISGKKTYDIIPEFFAKMIGLNGSEPYVLIQEEPQAEGNDIGQPASEEYLDIHAGGFETSLMLLEYKDLVDESIARQLKSSRTLPENLAKWQSGGDNAKEVTPLGYCGDPSKIDLEDAKFFTKEFAKCTAKLIQESLE